MATHTFNTGDVLQAGDLNNATQLAVGITGGTIDGVVIGGITPGAGAFTSLTARTQAVTDSSTNVATTAFVTAKNAAMTGMMIYQSAWNASTNTPALASGAGTAGYYYVVSVAGTTNLDGNAQWFIGDTATYNGTAWNRMHGAATEVLSVAGRSGAVVLANTDVTGLGTMSTQNASAVAITGGTVSVTSIAASTISAAGQITSTLATGTAPFVVTSTTPVANLAASTVTTNANLTGDVTSVGNTATLAASGVTAATYGTTSQIPQLTVDAKGRVISASSVSMTIPNLTGDVTSVGAATTLAASGVTAATYGSVSQIPQITVDGKGRVTLATTVAVASNNLTGDVTSVGTVTTLAASGITAATYGAAGTVPVIVFDGKGRATSATNTAIAIANTQVSGLGTMSTQNASAVAITGGTATLTSIAAGTHSATGQYTSTLATGTAPFVVASTTAVANLTASNVTTNANLTGDVTSVGNTATLAASGVTAATYGSGTQIAQFAVDSKGRVTSASNVTMTPANLTGDVTSVGAATTLAASGVTAGTYGSATTVPIIVFDAKGRATSVSTATVTATQGNLTGDVTSTGLATTLATVNSNTGTFGSTSTVNKITVDAKGRITAVINSSIAIANTQVSGLGTMSTQNANGVAITGGTVYSLSGLSCVGAIGTGSFTVANLPSASLVGVGGRAFVTDNTAIMSSSNIGQPVSGGGSSKLPVYSDGAGWYIG